MNARLLEALPCLTDKQREVIDLWLSGWSVTRIARQLDLDRKTVRDRLDAAERRLRRELGGAE